MMLEVLIQCIVKSESSPDHFPCYCPWGKFICILHITISLSGIIYKEKKNFFDNLSEPEKKKNGSDGITVIYYNLVIN